MAYSMKKRSRPNRGVIHVKPPGFLIIDLRHLLLSYQLKARLKYRAGVLLNQHTCIVPSLVEAKLSKVKSLNRNIHIVSKWFFFCCFCNTAFRMLVLLSSPDKKYQCNKCEKSCVLCRTQENTFQILMFLTLILLTSTKWWTPARASKWRMGFNSAFKGLSNVLCSKGKSRCRKLAKLCVYV
jgi:hypothetical protein